MGDIMNARKIFRITLAVMLIHSSVSTIIHEEFEEGNFAYRRMSPLKEKWEIVMRKTGMERRFLETQVEPEEGHERHRRQATGCCTVLPTSCVSTSAYRTMDGTCNNLLSPCRGSAGIPFIRLLVPHYDDDFQTPRFSFTRPRDVSSGSASISSSTNEPITLMLMQWGQFIDHDMTFTPDANSSTCCSGGAGECFPIDVSSDSFYSPFGITCLPLARSVPSNCTPSGSRREQQNLLTAFLDGSMIYGSSVTELNTLKATGAYHMRFGPRKENSSCTATNPSVPCRSFLPERTNNMTGSMEFFAGDRRVQEQPGLTSLHTIFLRMHNDLASKFKTLNPTCKNETIFQEIRKIIGALIQQITYDEFLPILLGNFSMTNRKLALSTYAGYNNSIDPSIANVFATAAFRFGHSLIKNSFRLLNTIVELSRNFNNHAGTLTAAIFPSEFMKGIAVDPSEQMDHIVVTAVRNFLFARSPFQFGEDLFSRNIQRGRDHGIPAYAEWVFKCFGIFLTDFDDLIDVMPLDVIDMFGRLYVDVQDIDLFPAGIAEFHKGGGILGPTFTCILEEMFFRLKHGDRYWFQNSHFSANQTAAIRKTTLAAIICQYAAGTTQLQRRVMESNRTSNPFVSCSTLISGSVITDINKYWKSCPASG